MVFKSVLLNVICSKKPYYLTIILDDCEVIKNKKVISNITKYHICTNKKTIRIIARYQTQTVYKTIYLNNNLYNNICVNFMFNTKILQGTIGVFTLVDASYGLPVKQAMLNLIQKNKYL